MLAASTLKVYARAWVLYREFCIYLNIKFWGLCSLPLKICDLAMFISFMHLKGFASSSIITYITAISYAHKMGSFNDPTSSMLIQKLLSATCKISPAMDSRLPITILLLIQLVASVDQMSITIYQKAMLKAMFSVAFFGLMRIGEIASNKSHLTIIQLQLFFWKNMLRSQLEFLNITFLMNPESYCCLNKISFKFVLIFYC